MRVLLVTNMYPTARAPHSGTFVAEQVESVRRLGVEVEVLHVDRGELGKRAYRGLAERIRAHAEAIRPDVVHAAYGGVTAEATTRGIRDRPVLVTFHGSDLLGHPSGGVRSVGPRLGVAASRLSARRAAGVIVVSEKLRGALPRALDPSRVWIIPNGVDLRRFQPQDASDARRSLGWSDDVRHVLFPAPPSRPEKRFGLARAAVEQLPSTKVELHALDGVPHDDVPLWLNAADVVLLTSTHEGSPVVIKEALACGRPIVSVDVGDVRERIAGVSGCHLAAATPEDLAAKVGLALAGRSRIEARNRVAELDLDRIAPRVREVYATLASVGGRARAA
jgi:glycosyltransferase involved in cell wall biosynthesis